MTSWPSTRRWEYGCVSKERVALLPGATLPQQQKGRDAVHDHLVRFAVTRFTLHVSTHRTPGGVERVSLVLEGDDGEPSNPRSAIKNMSRKQQMYGIIFSRHEMNAAMRYRYDMKR